MAIETKGKGIYSRGMAWERTLVGKYRWMKKKIRLVWLVWRMKDIKCLVKQPWILLSIKRGSIKCSWLREWPYPSYSKLFWEWHRKLTENEKSWLGMKKGICCHSPGLYFPNFKSFSYHLYKFFYHISDQSLL